MIDWWNSLTGNQPEEDDPVEKARRLLQQGASSVADTVSSATQSATDAVSGAAQAVAGYLPNLGAPAAPEPSSGQYEPDQVSRYVPSYAPQAAQVTAEDVPSRDPLPVLGQAVSDAYTAAEPYLTGPARTEPTWQDPLAPVREVVQSPMFRPWTPAAGYLATQQAFSEPIANALTEGASEEPIFRATVPESVPLVGGTEIAPSPRDVGKYAVQSALDPFQWAAVPGSSTPLRAAAEALPLVGEAAGLAQLGRAGLRGTKAAVRAAAEGLTAPPAALPEGVVEYGAKGALQPVEHVPYRTRRQAGDAPIPLTAAEGPRYEAAAAAVQRGGLAVGSPEHLDPAHPIEWHPARYEITDQADENVGVHDFLMPFYRTEGGGHIPLMPPDIGGMGQPKNLTYNALVKAAGGRKGFPYGIWTDARGRQHPFDSVAEVLAMRQADQEMAAGTLTDWWRGEQSPEHLGLRERPYISTNPEKGGEKLYNPDLIKQYAPGHPDRPPSGYEVVEVKPAAVLEHQEEYGLKRGVPSGAMGWQVATKSGGIMEALADEGHGYRLWLPRDAQAYIPLEGRTKRLDLVPGVDPRDRPKMRTKSVAPEATSLGNEVADAIHATHARALEEAAAGRARGLDRDQRRVATNRVVRGGVLPTAEIVGRQEGQLRHAEVGGTYALPSYVSHRGPLGIDDLAAFDPDSADALRLGSVAGAEPGALSIHDAVRADGSVGPQLIYAMRGDPQAVKLAAAELALQAQQRGIDAPDHWYHDAKGPHQVATIHLDPTGTGPGPDFDALYRRVVGTNPEHPIVLPRYNPVTGDLVGIDIITRDTVPFGPATAASRASQRRLADAAEAVRQALEDAGATPSDATVGRAERSRFAGEPGHASSPEAGRAQARQILGYDPLPTPAEIAERRAAERARRRTARSGGDAGGDGSAAGGPGAGRGVTEPGRDLVGAADDVADLADELDEDALYATGVLSGGPPGFLPPGGLRLGADGRAPRPRIAAEDIAPVRGARGQAARRIAGAAERELLTAGGGALGAQAVSGDIIPAEGDTRTPEERLRDAAIHGLTGAGLALGVRYAPRVLSTGTPSGSGYQAMLAPRVPPGGVAAPFAGIARAYRQAHAQNLATMQAAGITPPSPLAWLSRVPGAISHAALLGPGTATIGMMGGAIDALRAPLKEPLRAGVRALQTGNVSALREPGEALKGAAGAFYGHEHIGQQLWDLIRGQGRYASLPDRPRLAEQTAEPILRQLVGALEVPGRVWSGAPDAIFGTIARKGAQFREAAQMATDAGLSGDAWTQKVQQLLGDYEQARKAGAPLSASAQRLENVGSRAAERAGYQEELGRVGKAARGVATLGDAPIVGQFVSPYFNTPWNQYIRAGENTPAGLLMGRAGDPRMPGGGRHAFDRRFDAILGTSLIAGGLAYGLDGRVTGSGPSDPAERRMLRATGWRPNSYLVEDTYIPNRSAGQYEPILNAIGEAADWMRYQKKGDTPRALGEDAMKRVGRLLAESPAGAGIKTIMDVMDYGLAGATADVATRLTPGAAVGRTVSDITEPYERTVDTGRGVGFWDEVGQRWRQATGRRSGLPIQQDPLGREIENPRLGGKAFLPRLGQIRNDPTIQALQEAGLTLGPAPPSLGLGQGISIDMTPAERRDWQRARGALLIEFASGFRDAPWWQDPQSRQAGMQALLRDASTAASGQIQGQIPPADLQRRIDEALEKRKAG